MKTIDVTEADRTDRITMIGAVEGEDARFPRATGAAREFVGEFERHFHRRRAVIGKKGLGKVGRGVLTAPFGGSRRLLESFLATMDVWDERIERSGPPPAFGT